MPDLSEIEADAAAGSTSEAAEPNSKPEDDASDSDSVDIIPELEDDAAASPNRLPIRKSNNVLFVVRNPDVYKDPHSDTYIVLGEAKIVDLSQKAKAAAAEKFKAAEAAGTSVAPVAEEDEEEEDETGVDKQDIELVMQQADTTRAQAVRALKEYNSDFVNTMMDLSMV